MSEAVGINDCPTFCCPDTHKTWHVTLEKMKKQNNICFVFCVSPVLPKICHEHSNKSSFLEENTLFI